MDESGWTFLQVEGTHQSELCRHWRRSRGCKQIRCLFSRRCHQAEQCEPCRLACLGFLPLLSRRQKRCSLPWEGWAGKCQLTHQNLVCILITATPPSLPAITVALVINTDVIIEAKQFFAIGFYFYHVG